MGAYCYQQIILHIAGRFDSEFSTLRQGFFNWTYTAKVEADQENMFNQSQLPGQIQHVSQSPGM